MLYKIDNIQLFNMTLTFGSWSDFTSPLYFFIGFLLALSIFGEPPGLLQVIEAAQNIAM